MRERRFRKSKRPHKVFLVVCEGETEEEYINMLKRHYRLPIAIKTKVSGNTVNSRLVNQYIKELGLDKEDECSVFYVYDADIDCIVSRLLKMPGKTILSNPSIELWYLLHSKDFKRYIGSDSIIKELSDSHPVWKSYTKGFLTADQKSFLLNNQKKASQKAEKMAWPGNPSSNMHEFIYALESEML
ncbi:MAG: RloB family protein [Muribaculaceae bacterium]|nr:RloB family protein [Muribaculaceae bacterium]